MLTITVSRTNLRCEAPQEKLTSFLIREVSNDKKTFDRCKDQGDIESQ